MAAAGSLDDLLNSKVDESAFTALVGTLEDQLYSAQASSTPASTSGAPILSRNVHQGVSVAGASRADARVPVNGNQHDVLIAQEGNKTVTSNVSRGGVVSGTGFRNVSAHSQAGVIQTGHFPTTSQAAGSVAGSATNRPNVMKVVPASGSQTSSLGGTYSINSGTLPNGSTSGIHTVIANGKQTTAVGNRIVSTTQPSNVPTVITVNRPGTVGGTTVPTVVSTNPLTSGVQIVNVNQVRSQSPSMQKALAPRVVMSPQALNRAVAPGQQITLQTLQGLQNAGSGHLLVKTENGQFKLIQLPVQGGNAVAVSSVASTPLASAPVYKSACGGGAAYHPRGGGLRGPPPPPPPPLPPPHVQQGVPHQHPPQGVPHTSHHHHPYATHGGYLPNIYKTPAPTAPRTASASPAQPPAQNAMAPDTAKLKCKNFLATLLKLARDQPETVARNVRALIQNLIDARVEPEAFTSRLQQELNSSPQPCLVPFLKKSLPFLRQSLFNKEITIEGVKPPPSSALSPAPTAASQPAPQPVQQVTQKVQPRQASVAVTGSGGVRVLTGGVAAPRNVSAHPAMLNIQPVRGADGKFQSPSKVARTAASAAVGQQLQTSASRPPPVVALKKDRKLNFRSSMGADADDDINDVAAMGGVNLQEESQNILGGTEFVGAQIRSVKDEAFLPNGPLQLKIRQIAMQHGLDEPSPEVVSLVSHATQERLKTLLEQLALIAEHRMEVIKSEARYEVSRDVRGQLRFLDELDKLEQKRHEETEREMLMRAAKSRSKTEDPEQAKLKAKAKEMQRVEMEEVRQREANLTALIAIGPRKKPRLEGEAAAATADGPTVSGTLTQKQIPVRPRLKRVNIRDLLLLLEQERGHQRSTRLYKLFVK